MSFIDRPMDDVEELKIGPEGLYSYVIKSATDQMDGAFRKGILVVLEVTKAPAGVNVEELANVLHNISMPLPTDDDTKAKNKILFLKRFCAVANVDIKGKTPGQVEAKAFPGKQIKDCPTKVKNYEGKLSNILNLPQLPQKK